MFVVPTTTALLISYKKYLMSLDSLSVAVAVKISEWTLLRWSSVPHIHLQCL